MEEIILYTLGCPKCLVLEKKLEKANIKYTKFTDLDAMIKKGIIAAPMLQIGEELLDFVKAVAWVNSQGVK